MLNKISVAIALQDYAKALHLMKEYLKTGEQYTDSLAILEGSIYLQTTNYEKAFRCISDGLKINPLNYELYFMLGNLYEAQENFKKAYLCYENSIFHCKENEEDHIFLSSYFETFKKNTNTVVPKVSIVILTLNQLNYTVQCLDSIRKYCSPSVYELILVDNGSTDGTKKYLMEQTDIKYHFNETNLGFAGGCNVGIRMCEEENDIFFLNNDTIMTENALFTLRMGLYENDNIGAVGAVSNYADHQTISHTFDTIDKYMSYAFFNNIPKENALENRIFLVGFAFLLNRSAYNSVGDWDERFFPGNYEDNDYCTRLIFNDYQLLLCNNSFIFHIGNSTFSYLAETSHDNRYTISNTNLSHYIKKWNINPTYSNECRNEMIQMMDIENTNKNVNVLEIGCACGATLLGIKNKFPNSSVYGIELDEATANFASHIANVVQGNAELLDNPFQVDYDYIIMGDILEHLVHPEKLLKKVKNWLAPNGKIIASIPNFLHYSAIIPILMGNFAYTDTGILDRTHLRFFTLYNSIELLQNSGYQIEAYAQNRTPDSILDENTTDFIEQLCTLPNVTDKEQFFVLQYILKAKPCN